MTDNKAVVLTIDDEETIRRGLRNFLEDHGYSVLEAETGLIGLAVFERGKPDIVLVDLRMPEIDGPEVLKRIRALSFIAGTDQFCFKCCEVLKKGDKYGKK